MIGSSTTISTAKYQDQIPDLVPVPPWVLTPHPVPVHENVIKQLVDALQALGAQGQRQI